MEIFETLQGTTLLSLFDGSNMKEGETWFYALKRLKKGTGLDDKLIIFTISCHLVDQAEIWWKTVEDKIKTWDDFEKLFKERYLKKDRVEAWRAIKRLHQRENQYVVDFVMQFDPLLNAVGIEQDACKNSFLLASLLQPIARELEKENWETIKFCRLVEKAIKIEILLRKHKAIHTKELDLPVVKRSETTDTKSRNEALQKLPNQVNAFYAQLAQTKKVAAAADLDQQQKLKKKTNCWYCGKEGHMSSTCFHRQKNEKEKSNMQFFIINSNATSANEIVLQHKETNKKETLSFKKLANTASPDGKFVKRFGQECSLSSEGTISKEFIENYPETKIIVGSPKCVPSLLNPSKSLIVCPSALSFPDGSVYLDVNIKDVVIAYYDTSEHDYCVAYATIGIPHDVLKWMYKSVSGVPVLNSNSKRTGAYRWLNARFKEPVEEGVSAVEVEASLADLMVYHLGPLSKFMEKKQEHIKGIGSFKMTLKKVAKSQDGKEENNASPFDICFTLMSFETTGFEREHIPPPSADMQLNGKEY
ncbi:hypothetical protein G6F56_007905 [Rhizopus delemar]|nr:hypothetical protein G6F56_007905 [Rhizopus delemar]